MRSIEWPVTDFEKRGGIIAIAGVVVAAFGNVLGGTRPGLVGLAILGVGVLCWGLSGLIEKRILFFHPGVRYNESYYGVAARAWGALLSLAGLAVAGFSALLFFYPDITFERITGSPLSRGIGLFLGGLAGMLYSVTLITGRAETGGTWLRRLITLPRTILGLVLLMISIALTGAGVTRMLFPQFYERMVQTVSDSLPRAPQLSPE